MVLLLCVPTVVVLALLVDVAVLVSWLKGEGNDE
jgi:hypothetical protein